jgi:hypothetical protein
VQKRALILFVDMGRYDWIESENDDIMVSHAFPQRLCLKPEVNNFILNRDLPPWIAKFLPRNFVTFITERCEIEILERALARPSIEE